MKRAKRGRWVSWSTRTSRLPVGPPSPYGPARFVKDFLAGSSDGIAGAFKAYVDAVKSGRYPAPEHCFE